MTITDGNILDKPLKQCLTSTLFSSKTRNFEVTANKYAIKYINNFSKVDKRNSNISESIAAEVKNPNESLCSVNHN